MNEPLGDFFEYEPTLEDKLEVSLKNEVGFLPPMECGISIPRVFLGFHFCGIELPSHFDKNSKWLILDS